MDILKTPAFLLMLSLAKRSESNNLYKFLLYSTINMDKYFMFLGYVVR